MLPPLIVRWHEVPSDHRGAGAERDGQQRMFRNAAIGVTDAAAEKRDSLAARMAKLVDILAADPDAHRIIWHDLEDERRAIERALPGVVSVYGSQDLDAREQAIVDFSNGKFSLLAAKPRIAGSGCNFQRHCHKAVFLGVGYKFNDFIQAIFRVQRFLQTRPVEIDIIYSEAEREIRRRLEDKWSRHAEQAVIMAQIIREFGLASAAIAGELQRSIGVRRIEARGERWRAICNDCVLETSAMAENSVDLIVTSPPFEGQYEYTPSYNDFGHTEDSAQFWAQMDYLIPQLFRVLKPGRNACIHIKDRITPGGIPGSGFRRSPRSRITAPHISRSTASPFSPARRSSPTSSGKIARRTDWAGASNARTAAGWATGCRNICWCSASRRRIGATAMPTIR